MWSNCISIDKGEDIYFNELLSEIDGIKEVSSAVEESKNRKYLYMAGLCEYGDIIRDKVESVVADFILKRYKLRYYLRGLRFEKLNYAVATLVSTLVYLDYDLEKAYIERVFNDLSSYDIDGIFNFRLKSLRSTWNEILKMCNRLFEVGTDEQDIYNVIGYILETKAQVPKELIMRSFSPISILNAEGHAMKVKPLFYVDGYDVISAVIENSATKLTINCDVSDEAVNALKHIVRLNLK